MASQVFTIEAESVEAAREQARVKVPPSAYLFSEVIFCDGRDQNVEAVANTAEEALRQARERVPPDSEIVREITRIGPNESTIEVEATDEQSAIAVMKRQSSNTATLGEIELVSKAKKGFLGIGRRSNVYHASVSQPAVVEITFRKKAKLELEVGELPPSGFCQFCGKSGARQYVGAETNLGQYEDETIRYFCGRSSLLSFCKSKWKLSRLSIRFIRI